MQHTIIDYYELNNPFTSTYNIISKFIMSLMEGNMNKVYTIWNYIKKVGLYPDILYVVDISDRLITNKYVALFVINNKFNINNIIEHLAIYDLSKQCNICFDYYMLVDIINHDCCMNYCISCALKMPDNRCPCKQDIIEYIHIKPKHPRIAWTKEENNTAPYIGRVMEITDERINIEQDILSISLPRPIMQRYDFHPIRPASWDILRRRNILNIIPNRTIRTIGMPGRR